MTVCLLTIEDGRTEYHERSRVSLRETLPTVEYHVSIDDSSHALGFAGAVAEGWRQALATNATHIWHAELDFIYLRPIALAAMIRTLDTHPYLVQMALLRGPVNDAEHEAGGVIELHPEHYYTIHGDEGCWQEHRRFVTTNPSLWPRWVVERGWPVIPHSEGRFGIDLFTEDPNRRAAFWGDDGPWVHHIGDERIGWRY